MAGVLIRAAALALFWLTPAAQAQDFVPTEFELRLCDARRTWDVLEAEVGDLRTLRSQRAMTADDADRLVELSQAAHAAKLAFEAMYFKPDGTAFFMATEDDVDPVKYARFDRWQVWCLNLTPSKTPSDVMGLRTGVFYKITLFMPQAADFAKSQVVVFSGRKEVFDFSRAQISGRATWQTTFYEGPASHQVIKAVLWKVEDGVLDYRAIDVGQTDADGRFALVLPIRSSSSASRLFQKDIARGLISGFFPDGFIPPAGDPQAAALKALAKELPPKRDFTKFSIQSVTKLYAVWKDAQWIQSGKPGAPNLDQWRRNHATGRDNINALAMLIDVATSPATAHAQVADAANNWYKRLTGSPLPGVTEMTPAEKADLKTYYAQVWDHIGLTKFVAEHGCLPDEDDIRGLIE